MNNTENNKRILKNTLMLYFRQILIMLVALYTVRVILNTLGEVDYGIYNIVGGVVTMFGFLSHSMSAASQRYFSFEIGRGDYDQLKKIFSLSLTIYVLIGIIILLLAETVGLWFVNNKLVIPNDRMHAVQWIYQSSIISFLLTIITTPYMASIIAHENMNVYAYVSIAEVLLKLLIVYFIQFFSLDKLKLYGLLTLVVTFINTGIYRFICTKKYKECRFRFYWDYPLFKELVSYASWTLFGSISDIIRSQGIDILLNMYFGPIVNTARAVAKHINSAVFSFAQNFSTAVRPQIVKSYAVGKQSQMLLLVFRTSKAIFFLLFFLILPIQLELLFVLKLWLKNIPEYVLIFTRIILIEALIESLTYPLMAASHATGKIKLYATVVGGIKILNLPIAFIVLMVGFSAVSVQIIGMILILFSYFARIWLLSRQLNFSIWKYFKIVLIPAILAVVTWSIIPIFFVYIYPSGMIRLFLTIIISIISGIIAVLFIGLSINERLMVFSKIEMYSVIINKYFGKLFREKIRNYWDRWWGGGVKNNKFSILSQNCIGGVMLHDLGQPFLTPTINLHFNPCDFVKFLKNIHFYLDQPLIECVKEMYPYPVGRLFDINIYFVHYHSFEEAVKKWDERKRRINFDNLFIIMTDRHIDIESTSKEPYSCAYDVLQHFDELPFVHKICFTHKEYKELKSCFFLKEEEKNKCVGMLAHIVNIFGKRGYQQSKFDYVRWLNGEFKK